MIFAMDFYRNVARLEYEIPRMNDEDYLGV